MVQSEIITSIIFTGVAQVNATYFAVPDSFSLDVFRCTELTPADTFLTVCSLFHGIVLHWLDATHYRDINNSSLWQFAAAIVAYKFLGLCKSEITE